MSFKTHTLIPNKKLARQLAVRETPSLICEAVSMEGIVITIPEVQTLLGGITVGGLKISEQNIILNQAKAWKLLLEMIDENRFTFSKSIAFELHNIAGREKAIELGRFRTDNVTIVGTDYNPPSSRKLSDIWSQTEKRIEQINDVYDKGIYAFLQMAREKFFCSNNKQVGRLMMNGILLEAGFPIPVINVAIKRHEFNNLMIDFCNTGHMRGMNRFIRNCLNRTILSNFISEP